MKDSRCSEFNLRLSHPSTVDSLLAEHESGGGLTSFSSLCLIHEPSPREYYMCEDAALAVRMGGEAARSLEWRS